MRYVEVRVERNEHLAISRQVPPWEVPVLQLIHGNEKVVVTGEAHTDNQLPEDAAAELDRLNTRYGMHVASETSFATLVFGQGPKGVETIENLINRERMLEAKRPKQAEMVDDPTA